ncbi:uncharacterized protein CANTADRAFT_6164 [Suhomyces tanzawaensis NRRL Y-17324]|uniref:BTB domain-containing protein n=1 Tax=Suhomyces tanzawaensis NRRL Y-17324 TaxID=984487 RepID=A0A1E4SHK6_9ASCO|nr:uncharacterized protein CANTADRAFT_6164 [Suhomyces tanzawaensis NRRL Y-17324]ODV78967.1 hypothetical protein CANTADRAFT_6164 [Suhomyces tanzawaensis NRRL Y-17324]
MSRHPLTVEISNEVDLTINKVLPHDKVFSIQVGHRLFRASGLSLSSDSPSYFTKFFSEDANKDKVLFLDRNPRIFEMIYNHLQGYPLDINNDYDFVHLWLDSLYFGLRKLQKFLISEDIFANVGNRTFKIAKSLFVNTGNYPNYFTVLYDGLFHENIDHIVVKGILRPPPLRPATVCRSPDLFADLIGLLRGSLDVIRNDEHRRLLIRECKYYRFLELEQRIVKHKIINNPFSPYRQEIVIDLFDIHPKGVVNDSPPDKLKEVPLKYQRPFLSKEPKRSLIFQLDTTANPDILGYSEVKLVLNKNVHVPIVHITHKLATRMQYAFQEFSGEFTTQEISPFPCIIFTLGFAGCKSIINGREMKELWIHDIIGKDEKAGSEPPAKKRKEVEGDLIEFRLTRSLWRMVMRGKMARVHAVSIEGFTDQTEFLRNELDFL